MMPTDATVLGRHPQLRVPVMAEDLLLVECGGAQALADVVVGALGSMTDVELPLRLAFHSGRGEDYRLHVGYVYAAHSRIWIRRLCRGDRFVASFRVGRDGLVRDSRKAVSHA